MTLAESGMYTVQAPKLKRRQAIVMQEEQKNSPTTGAHCLLCLLIEFRVKLIAEFPWLPAYIQPSNLQSALLVYPKVEDANFLGSEVQME